MHQTLVISRHYSDNLAHTWPCNTAHTFFTNRPFAYMQLLSEHTQAGVRYTHNTFNTEQVPPVSFYPH